MRLTLHNVTLALLSTSALLACMAVRPTAQAQFPRSPVDPKQAERGAKIYASSCARCHGDDTRGTATAPDLIRSTVVLHDRREMLLGSELMTYLHTTPPHDFKLKKDEAADLSQFLTSNINHILRSGYDDRPTQLLSGDAKAGEAYFNNTCSKCHSATGDLAGIGKKYSAAVLQQKFLFPGTGIGAKKKTQVTVTRPGAATYTGDIVRIDDFTVSLRDSNGVLHSFNRTANTRVKLDDPYAPHVQLLQKYTDADIHNLTAYLDTLQ